MDILYNESVNRPCDSATYWKRLRDDSSGDGRSYNQNINPEDMAFHHTHKPCSNKQRDPNSHRIIEKRRRDRMNNCLAGLSKLIPAGYIKQGQGRIEKTEIVEMAIQYIISLQMTANHTENTGFLQPNVEVDELFSRGFQACEDELFKFLVDVEGVSPDNPFCVKIGEHLRLKKTLTLRKELSTKTSKTELENVENKIVNNNPGSSTSEVRDVQVNGKSKRINSSSMSDMSESINSEIETSNTLMTTSGLDSYSDSGLSLNHTASGSKSMTSSDDTTNYDHREGGKSYYKLKHIIRRRYSRNKESDSSSGGSATQEVRHPPCRTHKAANNNSTAVKEETEAVELPGFIIHPNQTHYVPISVPQSFLPDLLNSDSSKSNKLYHPISIPVHFSAAHSLKVSKNL